METLLTILGSVLGTAVTVGVPAYLALRKQKDAHEEEMAKIQGQLKSSEDARQNAAFDRLQASFDTQKQMFDDLLVRTQNLETDYKALKDEHAKCGKDLAEVRNELAALKQKG